MNSIRIAPILRRAIQCRRTIPTSHRAPILFLSRHNPPPSLRTYATPTSSPSSSLPPSSHQTADSILDSLQDQYATARDEFEIATEETEKKTVYAADDRAAAREEFDKLKEMFEGALKGGHGEEVRRRVGPRVRELENALRGLEISAQEDH